MDFCKVGQFQVTHRHDWITSNLYNKPTWVETWWIQLKLPLYSLSFFSFLTWLYECILIRLYVQPMIFQLSKLIIVAPAIIEADTLASWSAITLTVICDIHTLHSARLWRNSLNKVQVKAYKFGGNTMSPTTEYVQFECYMHQRIKWEMSYSVSKLETALSNVQSVACVTRYILCGLCFSTVLVQRKCQTFLPEGWC